MACTFFRTDREKHQGGNARSVARQQLTQGIKLSSRRRQLNDDLRSGDPRRAGADFGAHPRSRRQYSELIKMLLEATKTTCIRARDKNTLMRRKSSQFAWPLAPPCCHTPQAITIVSYSCPWNPSTVSTVTLF